MNDYSNDVLYNGISNQISSITGTPENVKYDVNIFIKEINVLSVINGGASLKFV